MPHFFINSKQVNQKKITISDKENYRHIVKSLRARAGEPLLLIDEDRIQYETTITSISQTEIISEINNQYPSRCYLDFNLYLAQSPLQGSRQSMLVEKAAELGVGGVYPIITDNCTVNISAAKSKVEKWQKIMYEASKQCERAFVPVCYNVSTIDKVLSENTFDKIIVFCERIAQKTIRELFIQNPVKKSDNVLVIIGPEGGFSQREFDYFKEKNLEMLTLGNLILKAETAAIAALGNIIYEYSNYNG